MRQAYAILLIALFSFECLGQKVQKDSLSVKKVALWGGVGYGVGLGTLSAAWYADQGFDRFKFFNDNAEWKQMDKIGHVYGTYHFSRINYAFLSRTQLSNQQAIWWSSGLSSLLFIPIEILDGFSPGFGFSYGDVIANAIGSGLFLGQQLAWKEQRIKVKYSFRETSLAGKRPDILGSGLAEEMLKDYNGQSLWLSFDLYAFFNESKIPKWLNFAAGYGAHNMVFARDSQNNEAGFNAYRQYFLGLDFDLSHIKSKKKWLRTLLFLVDMIRLPAPTLEINKNGVRAYLLYY